MSALPEGWMVVTLEEVCRPTRIGVDPRTRPGEPYIGLEHLEAQTTRLISRGDTRDVRSTSYEFHAGDTLYSRLRPYLNKVYWAEFPGLGSGEFIIFQKTPWLAPRFLKYLLNQPKFVTFTGTLDTGDRPRVRWDQVKSFQFLLPPIGEQERIVAAIDEELSRIDAGAAALERARARLAHFAASAVVRELGGESTTHVPLDDVLKDRRYGTSTRCSYDGHGMPVLRIPNVVSGTISTQDLKRAVDSEVDLGPFVVAPDDILVIRTNGSRSLIGRCAVVPLLPEPMACASYLLRLTVDRTKVNPHFVVFLLSGPTYRGKIERMAATSAGQYNISLSALRRLSIPVPPLGDQERAVERLGSLTARIQQLGQEIALGVRRARSLRSAILAAAFSGDLVRHDPMDEPASVLLDRIAAARAQPAKTVSRVKSTE